MKYHCCDIGDNFIVRRPIEENFSTFYYSLTNTSEFRPENVLGREKYSLCTTTSSFTPYLNANETISQEGKDRQLENLKYYLNYSSFIGALLERFDECCQLCWRTLSSDLRKTELLPVYSHSPPTEEQAALLMLRFIGDGQ